MVLRVAEVFYSLQGEGEGIGLPAVFLRLAGCHLRCRVCDTPYAWEGGEEIPLRELWERLEAFPARYLVVTGGEPLLQAEALKELLELLSGWTLALETSATLWVPGLLEKFHVITASPKLSSSRRGAFPHDTFSRYLGAFPSRLQVKLVVDMEDWEEVEELMEKYPLLGREVPLVIQPLEREESLDAYLSRLRATAESFLARASLWKRPRVRFLPQLHKILWWGRRGV